MAFSNKKSNMLFSTIKCFGKIEVGGAKKAALTSEKCALWSLSQASQASC